MIWRTNLGTVSYTHLVGKTVTAFNLAYSLRKYGKKVLAVDFDPQANLTTCFGAEDADVTIGDLLMAAIEDE